MHCGLKRQQTSTLQDLSYCMSFCDVDQRMWQEMSGFRYIASFSVPIALGSGVVIGEIIIMLLFLQGLIAGTG